MVGGHTEAEVEAAAPAGLSKWITTAKRFFTISAKDVDVKLANLARLQTSQVFQTDLQESMARLRERYDTLSFYYIHPEEKSDPTVFKENYQVHIDKLEKNKRGKGASIFNCDGICETDGGSGKNRGGTRPETRRLGGCTQFLQDRSFFQTKERSVRRVQPHRIQKLAGRILGLSRDFKAQ